MGISHPCRQDLAAHLVLVGAELLGVGLAGLGERQVHIDVGGALNLEAGQLLLAPLAHLGALAARLPLHGQLIAQALRQAPLSRLHCRAPLVQLVLALTCPAQKGACSAMPA